MDDRISTIGQEGRMLITPEDGSTPFYAKIEMADNPTQEGTALNKANLLQDETCVLLDLPTTSVPNDAFAKLALGAGNYGYLVKVQDSFGNPVSGMTVNGISTVTGDTAVTDENGEVLGVSTATSVSISINSPYFDLDNASQTVQSTGIITQVNLTMQTLYSENQAVTISSSRTIRFSPNVEEVDFCAIGGGGGGKNGLRFGAAGGGGYVSNLLNQLPTPNDVFSIQIGAGAPGGGPTNTPSNGGYSSISKGDSVILSANGGNGGGNGEYSGANGGTGNGSGGDGASPNDRNGENGSVYLFDDPNLGIAGGGGGGAGYYNQGGSNITYAGSGGSPYGGNGSSSPSASGGNGSGPGGGGGGGFYNGAGSGMKYTDGGNGASGAVKLRMRYKS